MIHRPGTIDDAPLLADLNQRFIRDEGHRNPMVPAELEERMRGWLAGDYQASIFEVDGRAAAYALYRQEPDRIYLRQFFVVGDLRRRGIGRSAIALLIERIWPRDKRLLIEVLVGNRAAIEFWRSVGFRDYSLALEIMPGQDRPG